MTRLVTLQLIVQGLREQVSKGARSVYRASNILWIDYSDDKVLHFKIHVQAVVVFKNPGISSGVGCKVGPGAADSVD